MRRRTPFRIDVTPSADVVRDRPPGDVVDRLLAVVEQCARRRGTVIWLSSPSSPSAHVPVEMPLDRLLGTLRDGGVSAVDGPGGLDELLRSAIDLVGCAALIVNDDGSRWVIPVAAADLGRA